MKKNFIYVAIACATTFAFVSCGNKEAKSGDDAAAPTTEAAAGINSVDQALDEYEKFIVEEYIPIMKKASAGDMDAVAKLQESATKLQAIAEQFSDASSFTAEQTKRLEDLAQKMADALTPQ